jgi:dienelactone hydrolase
VASRTILEGFRAYAVLQRISGTPVEIVATAALPIQPLWRDIRIEEHSKVGAAAGQTFQLQATLYRTRLPGRQPLVILNHGSTGGQDWQVPIVLRFEGEARFFLARGYNVVVPMRKGRGDSGGPFLEPSDKSVPTATQVASALEDLNTVIEAMRARPWVDPRRIILVGWSRGGFLSVEYSARHPGDIAGVVNFSGGWWPGRGSSAEENSDLLAAAGKSRGMAPELWLYAENDSYYTLPYARKIFDAFSANGGIGEFIPFENIHIGNGHALFEHVDLWKATVATYLHQIESGQTQR